MRIARSQIDCTVYEPDEYYLGGVTTAVEVRVVLNRFEAKVLHAALAVREWWFETVTYRLGRLLCRRLRRHNLTCRGRQDHTTAMGGIIQPDRWRYWPR